MSHPFLVGTAKKTSKEKMVNCADIRNKLGVAAVSSLRKNFNYKHAQIQRYFCKITNLDMKAEVPSFTKF